jgi:hypothetical protein
MYQLTIKDPGSLLSIILEQEITPAQASSIKALLRTDLAYNEVLDALFKATGVRDFDSPYGAGERVEAFRG